MTPESPHPDAPRVREIDFRRPSKFPRELVRYLERAHETFCRSASSRLSAELRTGLELAMAHSEQLPYGTAMAELPDEACIAVLDMQPIDTQVALLFEIPLALREGDVVPLRRNAAGTVVLHADEVPTFVATPGRNGNARAVQIRGPVGG